MRSPATKFEPSRDDIAIVGMSCRFAKTPNLRAFWRRILAGEVGTGPLRQLGDLYACDPAQVMMPGNLESGEEKVFFFALQLVQEALADAGTRIDELAPERVALMAGYTPAFSPASVNWLQHTLVLNQTMALVRRLVPAAQVESAVKQVQAAWQASLPEFSKPHIEWAWRHALPVRLAQALGISGPSCVADLGCLSGTASLTAAADSLRAKRCDTAIVAAVQPPLSPELLEGLKLMLPCTADGKALPFDRLSDGIAPGEGAVCLVLRRLREAKAQGDHVYAVIRGSGSSVAPQARNLPLGTAGQGLERALHAAFAQAARRFAEGMDGIDYYEAHASGAPDEDAAEIAFLKSSVQTRPQANPTLVVGGVKPLLGHTLTIAGLAGIVKTALVLDSRILPPSCVDDKEFSKMPGARPPLASIAAPRPWLSSGTSRPQRAAVSVLDVLGVAGCVILEASPEVAK